MVFAAGSFGGDRTPLAFALVTGVITAFNPCGFAMLPAYVSYFVGKNSENDLSLPRRLSNAMITGLLVTAGFMTVFGSIGIVASGFLSQINSVVPYVSMVVGVILAVLGFSMVRGYEPKIVRLTVTRARAGGGYRSMYFYGLSYAVVSLSCGFPGFASAVVASTREGSFVSKMSVYVAFTIGMGLVLLILSFAVALAQQAVVRGMRKILPYVNRISGSLLVVSGLYVSYYGYYEWRTIIRGQNAPLGPVAWVESWSTSLKNLIDGLPLSMVLIALVIVVGAGAASAVLSSGSRARSTEPDPSSPTESSLLNEPQDASTA